MRRQCGSSLHQRDKCHAFKEENGVSEDPGKWAKAEFLEFPGFFVTKSEQSGRIGEARGYEMGCCCSTGMCMIARQDARKPCSEIVTKLRREDFPCRFMR